MKQQAPYGAWPSPVSADLIVSQMIGVGGACLVAGDLYWQESRPQEGGRTTLLRRGPNGVTEELTPPPFNVRTRVHEYGGGAWVVLPEKIIFSNFADQQLYVATPGKKPEVLTHAPALRFANGVFDQPRNRIICVVEDHGGDGEPSNYLGGIDLDSGNLVKLTEGHDFYSSPTLSADGSRLAWITWDHPDMPWDTTTLWEATLAEGDLQNITVVAGGKNEAVQQPRYDNAGKLHYISDQNGWWNLYQFHQGKSQCLCEKQAEFGVPPWVFGQSTYTFTDNGIVCVYAEKNEHRLARLVDGNLTDIDTPFTAINGVSVAGNLLATTCASATEFPSIVLFDLQTHSMENVKKSGEIDIDPDCYSIPRSIEFATADNDTAHGFFYPPTNKDFQAPADELPPLIVILHGGPTAATHPVLSLGTQYWTSRGFAVLDVNYRGSTGYGRAYRQKLNRRWGIADVDDTVFGATHLADEGLVDRNRMAIRGGSAGGYTTLAALTFRDTFKAGASHYGIGDLEALLRDTHKFESRYPDSLVGAYPQDIDVYKARSPINHVEQLTCPVIFFQGLEDRIVPPNQAQAMVDALTDSGIPVAYVPFAGEQHGFRKAENIKRALELELYFYARIFDFDPADDIEGIPIVNLD